MLVATMTQLRSHDEEIASLRTANEQNQAEIAALHAAETNARAEIVRLGAINDHAEAELARLHDIIAALRRHRFGARSEKLDDEQLEMAFEDTETALGLAGAARPRPCRRRHRHTLSTAACPVRRSSRTCYAIAVLAFFQYHKPSPDA